MLRSNLKLFNFLRYNATMLHCYFFIWRLFFFFALRLYNSSFSLATVLPCYLATDALNATLSIYTIEKFYVFTFFNYFLFLSLKVFYTL